MFYPDVAHVYNGSSVLMFFLQVFQTHISNVFICFQSYVAIVVSGCFKTRSSVVSPSSPFCYLASVSGAERRRRSPLVWAGPTCSWVGAVDETLAGRHGTRDGAAAWASGRGLTSGHPNASYAHLSVTILYFCLFSLTSCLKYCNLHLSSVALFFI
jgi:hypothetical protein